MGGIIEKNHDLTCKINNLIVPDVSNHCPVLLWLRESPSLTLFYPDDEAPLFYWTVPECSLAVVCACLPTLRPIVHGITPTSLMNSMRSLLVMTSTRTSNSSRNVTSAYRSGWVEGRGHANESRVGISRPRTEHNSVKSSLSEVEMNDLEIGYHQNVST